MYKIIVDSCGELTQAMIDDGHFATVPLTLEVGGEHIVDDETFDQASFLQKVADCPTAPKSACPSPDAYINAMHTDAERIYVVTLSSQLSGSYNSACLARDLYHEDHEVKDIHVFDSKSASIGQTLIALKIAELENQGLSFDQVVADVDEYIAGQHTFFVLESLETLRKAGRLSNLKAVLASTLKIKPIMGSTDEGSIQQLGQTRGMAKALEKMGQCLCDVSVNCEDKILAISHCNCEERALSLKKKMESMAKFKDVFIVNTRGVSSLYAGDGGVIMVI